MMNLPIVHFVAKVVQLKRSPHCFQNLCSQNSVLSHEITQTKLLHTVGINIMLFTVFRLAKHTIACYNSEFDSLTYINIVHQITVAT